MIRALMKFQASAAALLLPVLLLGGGRPAATAAIIVVAPTASVAGSFTITQDITFTLTTGHFAGGPLNFVLDEWVTSDGVETFASYTPQLSLSLNGAAAQTYGSGLFSDNLAQVIGDLTANDGYFGVAGGTNPALLVGNTVTLKAASYTIAATAGFNPQGTQTFTGNMFMTEGSGTKLSNVVPAPEPGSAVLLLGGLALLGARRRR